VLFSGFPLPGGAQVAMVIDAVETHLGYVFHQRIATYGSIGTGHDAHPTADAFVFLQEHSPVRGFVQGSSLARQYTFWFLAMPTTYRQTDIAVDFHPASAQRLRPTPFQGFRRVRRIGTIFPIKPEPLQMVGGYRVFSLGMFHNAGHLTQVAIYTSLLDGIYPLHAPFL